MEKHFTVTVYIFHEGKVALHYHGKFNKWMAPGGHLELDETPPEAARREVLEETGMQIEFISQENLDVVAPQTRVFERPYLCLLHDIPAYRDKPAHQHMDLVYVARLVGEESVSGSEEWRWFDLAEIRQLGPEIFSDTKQILEHLFNALLPINSL